MGGAIPTNQETSYPDSFPELSREIRTVKPVNLPVNCRSILKYSWSDKTTHVNIESIDGGTGVFG